MSERPSAVINRRLVLRLAGSALAAPGVLAAAAPGLATADEMLNAYRRIRYSTGREVTFWWMRAIKFGLVDSQLVPIFAMEVGNFARTRDLGPGKFTATSLEMVFFTSLETGERVDVIVNPYTGERIPREDSLVGPTTITYTADGPQYPASLPGVRFDISPSMGVFAAEGDDVWLRDDNSTRVIPAAPGAPDFRVTDWATYHCRRSALADPRLDSVPATVSFNSVSSWINWINMGNRPGSMLTRASGRKAARLEDMPDSFTRILRARYPELARDPVAALDRAPFEFSP